MQLDVNRAIWTMQTNNIAELGFLIGDIGLRACNIYFDEALLLQHTHPRCLCLTLTCGPLSCEHLLRATQKYALLALSNNVLLSECSSLPVLRSSHGFAHDSRMLLHGMGLTFICLKLVQRVLPVTQS